MPIMEMEKLETESSEEQISAAVSACIAMMVREGKEQSQAIAACHEMARGKTGGRPAPKGSA